MTILCRIFDLCYRTDPGLLPLWRHNWCGQWCVEQMSNWLRDLESCNNFADNPDDPEQNHTAEVQYGHHWKCHLETSRAKARVSRTSSLVISLCVFRICAGTTRAKPLETAEGDVNHTDLFDLVFASSAVISVVVGVCIFLSALLHCFRRWKTNNSNQQPRSKFASTDFYVSSKELENKL